MACATIAVPACCSTSSWLSSAVVCAKFVSCTELRAWVRYCDCVCSVATADWKRADMAPIEAARLLT